MAFDPLPDLAFILRDAPGSVVVSLNGATTHGVLDTTDEDLLAAEASHLAANVTVLVVATGSLPGLAEGTTIQHSGARWRVGMIRRIGIGDTTRIYCAPAA